MLGYCSSLFLQTSGTWNARIDCKGDSNICTCQLTRHVKTMYQGLFVVVLRPSNIKGHIKMGTDVCTHGDFIVLLHWETRPSAP